MPRRRGVQTQSAAANGDGSDGGNGNGDKSENATSPPTSEQCAVEFFRRAMRSDTHWRPSMALAKCLGVAQGKVQLTHDKDDMTNLVWVTVLVLTFCAAQLADHHELWYKMADGALAWLYQQPHFIENREDLVQSACLLLNARDASSLLANVFPEPKDEETRALEASLGDWKICYLDEPPYSMYYWNEKTSLSTWRNPLETAQLDKERIEKKRQRDELLAKALLMRVRINRDRVVQPPNVKCDECSRVNTMKNSAELTMVAASTFCVVCGQYFCDNCCDRIHSLGDKVKHIESSFHFVECYGFKGFPKQQDQQLHQINSFTPA